MRIVAALYVVLMLCTIIQFVISLVKDYNTVSHKEKITGVLLLVSTLISGLVLSIKML